MGLRDLLCIPIKLRRERSKARSEAGPAENPGGAGPSLRLPAASAPDLRLSESVSPAPCPSTSHAQEPNDHPSGSGHAPVVSDTKQITDPGSSNPVLKRSAADESKPDLPSLASSAAKFILRGIRESADVFGPLKSAAGGLCYVLDNCEQMRANKQSIESLAPRIKALADTLCVPVPEGDIEEKARRNELERKLEEISGELESLTKQGKVEGFFNNVKNADTLVGLVEGIRDAVMQYQTSLQQGIYEKHCALIERADLALLDRMYHVTDAGYLCGDRQGCMKGTRIDILSQLESWLNDHDDKRVFWLNGLAGTGKSTIAQTFAEMTFADGKLGASFFCSRDFDDRSSLRSILPTLAYQLAYRYPRFREALLPVLTTSHDVGRESLYSQMEKLIVRPLQTTQTPTLVVIDALDECRDEEPASAILSVLSRFVDKIPSVKFFITGRPESRIRSGFRLGSLRPITEVFKLHEVEQSLVDNDIRLFFRTRLTEISKARGDYTFAQDWPKSSEIEVLCKKAAGFFIYASVVVKFVASKNRSPIKQLDLVISLPQSTVREGKGIDPLYTQVLEQAVDDVGVDDEDKEEIYSSFKTVVGGVLLVFNPLSMGALSKLLNAPNISTTLSSLHSLLLIPEPERIEDPIHAFHKSFPDFLTDPKRCSGKWFFVDQKIYHAKIFLFCLGLMKGGLKKNICNLDDHAVLSEVKELPTYQKKFIGGALEYACHFWTKHLLEIPGDSPYVEEAKKEINEFFITRLLHWVEVLILTRNLGIGVHAMNDIERWCISAGIPCTWTNDTQRFLLEHFDTINDSPSHIYHSALPFCPSTSWLQENYKKELLDEVKVVEGLPVQWGTCSRTVFFSTLPRALSHWENMIAVALASGDVHITDAVTGGQMAIFSGHEQLVISIAFSPDGSFLASGGNDMTIKLWDVQTGGTIKTLFGHTDAVCFVSISADSTTILSGSDDETIRLWDIQTGKNFFIMEQESEVDYLGFSPTDPHHFVSISEEKVQHWDTNGHEIGEASNGSHIAFSLDGTQFALCLESVVTIQNSISKQVISKFEVDDDLRGCCFSPDGSCIAVATGGTASVWDVTSSDPYQIETFVGHTDDITALVFSSPSSIITASVDQSIKFWQVGTLRTEAAEVDSKFVYQPPPGLISVTLQAENDIVIKG